MAEELNNQPLGPRFKITKNRVGGEAQKAASEPKTLGEFAPEKVIYVEIDDEITNVFDHINRAREKKIALVIPRRANLLQSIVNLKILKKKFMEIGKEIIIVTTDTIGLQLAEKAGIPAVEKLFERNVIKKTADRISQVRNERPTRFKDKKVSISEVIRQEKPDIITSLVNKLKEKMKRKKQEANRTRLVLIAPNKQALFTLILVSVLLLLAIAYIALPGATVYLTPKSGILDPSFNVSFLDYGMNRSVVDESDELGYIVVGSYRVQPPAFTKKINYGSTGKISKGQRASGFLTVTNLSTNPWDLAATTRFQTDDGLIFRTPIAVRVPPAGPSGPGKLNVAVTADEFDSNNQVIGTRGNIGPSKFSLPGLKNSENQKKLYAENTSPMTGGTTETIKMAVKDDIEAAKAQLKRDIIKGAPDELKRYLEQQNLINKTNLSLLTDTHVLKLSEPTFTVQENLTGQAVDQFEVSATYTAQSLSFDREKLVNALKERLVTRVDPDKKIIRISDDDISFKYLDEDANAGKVRFTVVMRAIQVYELDPERENGQRFIKKIADHILGMRIEDAITYLQQQTDEIARVDIKTWPMWAPTIPNIADNIKFEIVEEPALQ